jgi:UDP-N-acetyl-D-galactosamine dehydrogenase
VDVITALTDYGIAITIYDPLANPSEVQHEYGLITTATLPKEKFDAVVLGVAHREFLAIDFSKLQNENSLLYDVKGILGDVADGRL